MVNKTKGLNSLPFITTTKLLKMYYIFEKRIIFTFEISSRMKKHITLIGCLLLLAIVRVEAQFIIFHPRGVGGGGALFFPRINPANNDTYSALGSCFSP